MLTRAAAIGVAPADMPRLVLSLASAGSYRSHQRDVLDWVEEVAAQAIEPSLRAAAFVGSGAAGAGRIWRSFDFRRVEALAEDIADESTTSTWAVPSKPGMRRGGHSHGQDVRVRKGGDCTEMLAAVVAAVAGDIDWAIVQLEALPYKRATRLDVDTADTHAYWLLERGTPVDARAAAEIPHQRIERAHAHGTANLLTPLYSSLARQDDRAAAQYALEQTRQAADRTEPKTRLLLALAAAEVLPAADSKRKLVRTHARTRIVRTAERRENPFTYCSDVRLNRRSLELSGGVPSDLPRTR